MGMPLEQYYSEIIGPILAEFKENFSCLHKGFSAVHAVDSLAAHIFLELEERDRTAFEKSGFDPEAQINDISFRNRLADINNPFQLIRDVAKANKHAKLTQGDPRVNGSADISAEGIGFGQGG